MQRICARCGKSYEAKRRDSKFCGSTCRSAQSLHPVGSETLAEAVAGSIRGESRLVEAVEAELRAAGRLETARGYMAVELAKDYGSSLDNGSQKASLMREIRATLDAALEGASVADDPLDELKARRVARRSG